MRRLAALALGTALTACSGSSAVGPGSTTTPPPATGLPSPHSGIVGAIDQARLLAFCENVRLARTAYDVGQRSQARTALDGAEDTLRQPPDKVGGPLLERLLRTKAAKSLGAELNLAEAACT